jgi:hypothetical protein
LLTSLNIRLTGIIFALNLITLIYDPDRDMIETIIWVLICTLYGIRISKSVNELYVLVGDRY